MNRLALLLAPLFAVLLHCAAASQRAQNRNSRIPTPRATTAIARLVVPVEAEVR